MRRDVPTPVLLPDLLHTVLLLLLYVSSQASWCMLMDNIFRGFPLAAALAVGLIVPLMPESLPIAIALALAAGVASAWSP